MKFVHIGVPTKTVQPNETYVDALKVHITNPDDHEYKYEYLRFEPCSPLPAIMQVNPHIAIEVEDMKAALAKCQEILVEPMDMGHMTMAFAIRDGVIFEFMENR